MITSAFSTVRGNHLVVSLPSPSLVRASTQEFPVHLSSRIEPRFPPFVALVMVTVKQSLWLRVPLLGTSIRGRERKQQCPAHESDFIADGMTVTSIA